MDPQGAAADSDVLRLLLLLKTVLQSLRAPVLLQMLAHAIVTQLTPTTTQILAACSCMRTKPAASAGLSTFSECMPDSAAAPWAP